MRARTWAAVLAVAGALGCGAAGSRPVSAPSVAELRASARSSGDGELVGRWALSEMLAPGGSADEAAAARKRLDAIAHDGMWASLARAVADDAHGDPRSAADAYVASLTAAARSAEQEAPLVGWFAVRHLLGLRGSVTDLYLSHRAAFDGLLARPGHAGWRSVAELEDWRAVEVYDKAEQTGDAYDTEVVRRMGCARGVRLAGPFGHGGAPDRLRSYAAERPAPWPVAWAADPMRGSVPHVLPVTQSRCLAVADEQVQEGVFYAETFFTTRGDRELLVAVQGALEVWVDDAPVLTRGIEDWGSWQRFGAHLSVGDGRHRVLARLLTPAASVRLLNPDGTAAGVVTDGDARAPYSIEPPAVMADPNPLDAIVRAAARGDSSLATTSPIEATLAAYAAHSEQMDDVASALIEPLVDPQDGAAVALQMASTFLAGDPALPEDAREPKARGLRERALARDGRLWRARLMSILDGAGQHGLAEAVEPLRKLADEVRGEPEVLEQLAQLYGKLGWRGDQVHALADLAQRFPDDVAALHSYLDALDEDGPATEADQVAARIKKRDPDSEVDLDRALARRDYKAAIAELERLKKRRPDRKEIAARVADVLARSGDPSAAAAEIEKALAKHPRDAQARFRLADRAYAGGDTAALRRALAAALQTGASAEELRTAIDLLEGATDLEPYRKDGRAVIREFEAWEKAGHHMDGTAARVLDYAATWAHPDGSSEMLEHEIQKIQSQEAINSESETEPPGGLVLHLRVIKPDGRVLEPEPVAGKPTLTLPHLEVGDYVELEHITPQPGDGAKGRQYHSPHWFFREADKGYWRSEFIVVTPADRELEIETRGSVPPPAIRPVGTFVERRWRIDLSPPAEVEPESPPITEFLPSVRVGWGISLEATLAHLVDLAGDETPLDPRLRAKALELVRGVAPQATDERARRLYRWVVEHVQDGKEVDGRRVVTGGTGSRQAAFRYMLRLLGIESQLALVKNRLATPPLGKMSEVEEYDALVMRVPTDKGVRWMMVRDKFAPYAYVPAELREQPAIVLAPDMPRDVVHSPGATDGVTYEGRADVREDGSATLDLVLTFSGNRAIAWRNALDQIPQAKLYDFVERELVAPSFDGGHVRDLKVEGADALDQPLVMRVRLEVPQLAKPTRGGLTLHPPFAPSLGQLAALPERHTPLLRRTSWHAEVRVRVVLPDSTRMPAEMPRGEAHDGDAAVVVKDTVNGHAIDFDRLIDLAAGRVQPGEEYAAWQKFVRAADALVTRDVLIGK
ncbi:MAG TPA: tetratricopeptide repeat protein [Polyangiaceae bacterium]